MNWIKSKTNWKQCKSKAQLEWKEITDDEWHEVNGRRNKIVGLVREGYCKYREQAHFEVDE